MSSNFTKMIHEELDQAKERIDILEGQLQDAEKLLRIVQHQYMEQIDMIKRIDNYFKDKA
jgi:hypothetical protein